MKASGLTHGGFYKHFKSKDDLLVAAVDESVRDIGSKVIAWAKQARPGEEWKEIVKKYLSIEHCEHADMGCPMAALAPDIARTQPSIRRKILGSMEAYRKQLVEFMPGRSSQEKEKNFTLIFTAMLGALSVARTMSDLESKNKVLGLVRDNLLANF
jgi:TetR/AcrR family transcriptional repressor of nem operon